MTKAKKSKKIIREQAKLLRAIMGELTSMITEKEDLLFSRSGRKERK